jgi:DNA polymerase III alpha subunit
MERLVAAGALDEIEPDRSRALAAVAGMVDYAQRRDREIPEIGERPARPHLDDLLRRRHPDTLERRQPVWSSSPRR